MLAEDPSSILGGSTGTWENPGPHFFYVNRLVFFSQNINLQDPRGPCFTSFFDDADDRRDEQDLLL